MGRALHPSRRTARPTVAGRQLPRPLVQVSLPGPSVPVGVGAAPGRFPRLTSWRERLSTSRHVARLQCLSARQGASQTRDKHVTPPCLHAFPAVHAACEAAGRVSVSVCVGVDVGDAGVVLRRRTGTSGTLRHRLKVATPQRVVLQGARVDFREHHGSDARLSQRRLQPFGG